MPTPAVEERVMDFYEALDEATRGAKVRRQSWPEGTVIYFHAECLHIRRDDGTVHTLIVSAVDVNAADWVIEREH